MAVAAALAFGALAPAGGAKEQRCPKAWVSGWQQLANKVNAPVYCPAWMPNPLDARIGGEWQDIYSIDKDRSYLVSFLSHGEGASGDVHVNFRGYPGRITIPTCNTTILEGSKTIRGTTKCFSDAYAKVRAPRITATAYHTNQDADQWHILLAWRYHGSLYTVSQHVIVPYDSSTRVLANLRKLLSGLVLVRPQG